MADHVTEIQAQVLELGKKTASLGSSVFDNYQTSLTTRYCSREMSQLFSQRSRHSTWRQLWLYLAESEKELGIDTITDEALDQMRSHLTLTDNDFEVARVEEKRRRHDVMAHVHAFGEVAPAAAGIIHYGATSCYVTDNAELILMRNALDLLLPKLAKVISNLAKFALEWKATPTLGYTHLQPAQLPGSRDSARSSLIRGQITIGKRAAQWAQDLQFDLENIQHVRDGLKFRGAQGTTGTQASFMEIFKNDSSKCDKLNELLCKKAGFPACYPVSTQTYSRKVDLLIGNAVAGLGPTAQKICGDLRHLASWKEIEEPFERTLDDSAIRRIDIPESFLLADAILLSLDSVTSGLVVYQPVAHARVMAELPFMVTENIIMRMVSKGKSRQEAHEHIRVLAHEAGHVVKTEGKPNDLIARIRNTEFFAPVHDELDGMMNPEMYIGRSAEIVERYCGPGGELQELIKPYKAHIEGAAVVELNV
ncbi:Uu.00g147110.m01.CDS01 [Anthostomella pinea]|uniref:Adenylosuccinate lyase n=1 Tax=Anthostomella pinea TaxID=933095 RepID=A0AAI8VKU8_9PEZI|nr:Uu.00g147110.m01.CDS01 [Anthostomella pinea]